jgi:hypothetical protein
MIGLLRTIAIILIIYYAFKIIGRYIMPIFLKRMVNNVEKKYQEQQKKTRQPDQGEIGKTVIDKKPTNNRTSNNNVGEYVDYEELND